METGFDAVTGKRVTDVPKGKPKDAGLISRPSNLGATLKIGAVLTVAVAFVVMGVMYFNYLQSVKYTASGSESTGMTASECRQFVDVFESQSQLMRDVYGLTSEEAYNATRREMERIHPRVEKTFAATLTDCSNRTR